MPGGPVGTYRYRKTAQPGGKLIEVQVFLLRVKRQHATWPEAHERERRWFSPAEAAVLVHEPDLRAILLYACGLVISGVTSAAT